MRLFVWPVQFYSLLTEYWWNNWISQGRGKTGKKCWRCHWWYMCHHRNWSVLSLDRWWQDNNSCAVFVVALFLAFIHALLSILRYTLFNLLLIMIYRPSVILAHTTCIHCNNKCAPLHIQIALQTCCRRKEKERGGEDWAQGATQEQGGPSVHCTISPHFE